MELLVKKFNCFNLLSTATISSNLDIVGVLVMFVVAIDSFQIICRKRSSLKSYLY